MRLKTPLSVGKSLTYLIPIFNAVINGDTQEAKVWAIIVYLIFPDRLWCLACEEWFHKI
jgi:hypothetical protein